MTEANKDCRWSVCHGDHRESRFFTYLLVYMVMAYLPACATTHRTVIDPEAVPVLALLRECSDSIDSSKGVASLTVDSPGTRTRKLRFAWVAARPSDLRLDVLGLWGQPLYRFLLSDDEFYLHDISGGEHYQGSAGEVTLKRLLGVPVKAHYLHSLLLGCLPLTDFQTVRVGETDDSGRRHLMLYGPWNRLTEKIRLKTMGGRALEAEFFDVRGNDQYTVVMDQFRDINGLPFPRRMAVSGENGAGLSMDIRQVRLNGSVPRDAFHIHPLDGP